MCRPATPRKYRLLQEDEFGRGRQRPHGSRHRPAPARGHGGARQAPARLRQGGRAHPRGVAGSGIEFLTSRADVHEWRQEFILLSDTLGVSMLVDAINNRRPSGATENTILGPFYVRGAALAERHQHLPGRQGRADDCARPGARHRWQPGLRAPVIDVWQTNEDGFYDVQQKGVQPDWNLRGVFTTDEDGEYWFRLGQASLLPDPRRRAGRQDAGAPRAASQPPRPHPFHRHRAKATIQSSPISSARTASTSRKTRSSA